MLFPENENQRLEVLHQYQIIDTPPDEVFDELVKLAANVCETPIALISLVDAQREWFKAKIGITISEFPRNISFGNYTILQNQILIIPDTLQDEQFAVNPLVISEPYCRFYAGVPLVPSSGFALGSLCVIDVVPRNLSFKEQLILEQLARQVIRNLELHQQKIIAQNQISFDSALLTNSYNNILYFLSNEFIQSIFNRIPLMIALIDSNRKPQWVNQQWERVLGWNLKDFQTRDVLEALYPNPEDRQSVTNFIQSEQLVWDDFKTQTKDGRILDTSWTNIHLLNGQMIGIGQEISERKQTELSLKIQAEREQLMRTVAQRIRQSLNLQDILNATVKEVRDLLGVERVLVYQLALDMSGKIVAESVEPGWTVALGLEIEDTCFQTGSAGVQYYHGRKRAIANIYEAGLTECHLHLLQRFEVKANLVVPILLKVSNENTGFHLWGLLVAHQCSGFRQWEEHQLNLLDQVTVQLAIAIQQSSIFQQAQTELSQRQKIEVKLRSALAEKEVLLKEIHHRVKNNLQIVSSLLQLQSQTLKDPEGIKVLRESQNRIESISLIHKNLYTTENIGEIDVADYIHNLVANLRISYQLRARKIRLETDIDSVKLNLDQAIACGLVINELISNAFKHAFPYQEIGKISITLRNVDENIEMTIRDNGIGLPDNLDWRNTDSLGLSLVYDLVTEQLEGNITLESQQGTGFKIQFTQLTLDK